MPSIPRHLDGWTITAKERADTTMPWLVIASDEAWQRTETAEGMDLESALLYLAKKIHCDRIELLAKYGL